MRKITDDEIQFFDDNGFVICRGVLHADELANFRAESARLVDEIVGGGPADAKCMRGPEGIPYYLTFLHSLPNSFSLRLLAHPFIGDLLMRMVGSDFIPCFESLVFKLPHNGSSVPWHRDGADLFGDERVFNIDIYPDKSTVENSCVWVVPGSHKWDREQAAAKIAQGKEDFALPDAVPATLEAGDVLLHHVKVLHGSDINRSGELRRVVYFDNRALRWNDHYHWFSQTAMEKRARLYQYALHERRQNPYPCDDEVMAYAPPAGVSVWHPGESIDLEPRLNEPAPT